MVRNIRRKNGKLKFNNRLTTLIEKSESRIEILKNSGNTTELKEEQEWLNKLLEKENKTLRT